MQDEKIYYSSCCSAEITGHYLDVADCNDMSTRCPDCKEHCSAELDEDIYKFEDTPLEIELTQVLAKHNVINRSAVLDIAVLILTRESNDIKKQLNLLKELSNA